MHALQDKCLKLYFELYFDLFDVFVSWPPTRSDRVSRSNLGLVLGCPPHVGPIDLCRDETRVDTYNDIYFTI